MGSMNISITDEAYLRLKERKTGNESFSKVIVRLTDEKDIRRCYGLLKDYPDEMAIVRKGALKAREEKWRDVRQ